jgi:PhzF family phenazine biosynthesis protein
MSRAYKVVDVFTATPLRGNPVAVVLDADGLDTETMQAVAAWTNLSETAFLLPPERPDADYRLRIFTPRTELPFAGHPTLGSAHAAIEAGRVVARNGRLVQECGVGLVHLNADGEGANRALSLLVPPATVTPLDAADVEMLESIVGTAINREVQPAIVNVGPMWIVACVSGVDRLLSLKPDFPRSAVFETGLGVTGVTLFAVKDGTVDIEVRTFASSQGINEDPVCGSCNGGIAVFRYARGLLPLGMTQYVATQGQCLGRSGVVTVRVDTDGKVDLGGRCVTTIEGVITTSSGRDETRRG